MANEPFITRKDLEEVTQKVAIQNSKDIAKPLVDQQKNNDLKELERSIEQKALFQDIADGIRGLGDSLLKGLKGLIPKTDGGLSKLLGLGLGLLLAPFAAFVGFLGQLGRELNFFTKGRAGKWLANFKLRFQTFFSDIFKKIKNSKLGKFVGDLVSKLKNSKLFKSISSLFQKVFGGKASFFGKLRGIFSSIVKFATGGPFKAIMKFAGSIGRILGKVFLPITILMSIFDFVKGFMRGYEEGGIIEGIKQGIMDLFDGLVGSLLRILMWIPTKIAEFLGLDKFAKQLGKYTETFIQSIKDIFGGLVDLVVGIFTWDTQKMKGAFTDIWNGILEFVKGPFLLIGSFLEDIFDFNMEDLLEPLNDAIDTVLNFFNDIGQAVDYILDQVPDWIKEFVGAGASIENDFLDTKKINLDTDKLTNPGTGSGINLNNMASNTANDNSANVINNVYNINSSSSLSSMALRNAMLG